VLAARAAIDSEQIQEKVSRWRGRPSQRDCSLPRGDSRRAEVRPDGEAARAAGYTPNVFREQEWRRLFELMP
jgi:hypothetical protein